MSDLNRRIASFERAYKYWSWQVATAENDFHRNGDAESREKWERLLKEEPNAHDYIRDKSLDGLFPKLIFSLLAKAVLVIVAPIVLIWLLIQILIA